MPHHLGYPVVIAAALSLAPLVAAPVPAQQQSKEQQKCIVALNTGLKTLTAQHWSHHLKCLNDAAAGKLQGTVEECVNGDPEGKLAKAKEALRTKASTKCTVVPDFGPLGAETVGDAATFSADRIVRDLFGQVLDAQLVSDASAAKCQQAVGKALQKCQDTLLKGFNSCTKDRLKGTGGTAVTSAQELQDTCLGSGANGIPDPKAKIATTCHPQVGAIASALASCTRRSVDLAGALRGATEILGEGFSQTELNTYLPGLARCAACRAINSADNLSRDCDLFDNGVADASCGSDTVLALEVGVTTTKTVYTPGQTVVATVHVTSKFAVDGTLALMAFDANDGPATAIYQSTQPLSVAAGASTQLTVQFAATQEGSYVLLAQLPTEHLVGEGSAKFGVRPTTMASLPETILHAEIETLDVPAISTQLESAAASGAPVTIQLGGESFTMEVESTNPFELDAGETLPGVLQSALYFSGRLCDSGGACDPESGTTVVFTVAKVEGSPDTLFAMIARKSDEVLWIEPRAAYDSSAPLAQHLVYRSSDVAMEYASHGDPLLNEEAAPYSYARSVCFDGIRRAYDTSCPPQQSISKRLRIRVFDQWLAGTTAVTSRVRVARRMAIFMNWRQMVRDEFYVVRPRLHTGRLTVSDVVLSSWKVVDPTRYQGFFCNEVFEKFYEEYPTDGSANHVLFTTKGYGGPVSGCLGSAKPGGPDKTGQISMVRDVDSLSRAVVTLAQEVGHNWDWHNDWFQYSRDFCITCPCSAHDAHFDKRIKESWWVLDPANNDRVEHCTVMMAGYRCRVPHMRYAYFKSSALEHLAEGMCRLGVPITACDTSVLVPAGGYSYSRITSGSSTLAGSGSCSDSNTAPEEVFQWTPAVSGRAIIDTCGSSFNTMLYLQTGGCATFGTQIACNDEACGAGSRITPMVTAGQTYFIVVDGLSGQSGSFRLTVSPPGSPCLVPTLVPPSGGVFSGTTSANATILDDAACGYRSPQQVFQWTPAASGSARIHTCGSQPAGCFYLMEGNCTLGGSPVSPLSTTTVCAPGENRTYSVTAGKTYYIMLVGSPAGQATTFSLTIEPPQPPPIPTPIPARPDLVIESIDDLREEGGYCVVYYTIANVGTGNASASTTVVYTTLGDGHASASLAPGQRRQESQAAVASPPCTGLQITVSADFYNQVTESNETNNSRSAFCSVGSCVPIVKRVFLAGQEYDGNLGGLAGADAICAAQAAGAGLSGAFKAWLSDGSTSAAERLTHATVPYVRADGVVVADNWTDLTDGSLAAPINVDASGVSAPGQLVWTGTLADGTKQGAGPGEDEWCCDWTCNLASERGRQGNGDTGTQFWSSSVTGFCDEFHPLYCLEQ